MKTLLKIQSSLAGSNGQSSQLADQFSHAWLTRNPDGRVIVRDLSRFPIPHLTAERFAAFGMKPEERTEAQRAIVAESDELIDELRAADTILFAVPMYNFSVPSTLRSYFDHVARAGVTFRYTANGPEGLLTGKKVYAFITRGGIYASGADTQTPYLRQFLGFIGLTDIEFVYAEGLAYADGTREKSLAAVTHTMAGLLEQAAAIAA